MRPIPLTSVRLTLFAREGGRGRRLAASPRRGAARWGGIFSLSVRAGAAMSFAGALLICALCLAGGAAAQDRPGLPEGNSGIADVPGVQAELVGDVRTQAAKNLVALNTIIRLIKNGVPLTEIPSITVENLAENVSLRQADRRPPPKDKARRLTQDVLEATSDDLDDLRASASDGPFAYFVFDVLVLSI